MKRHRALHMYIYLLSVVQFWEAQPYLHLFWTLCLQLSVTLKVIWSSKNCLREKSLAGVSLSVWSMCIYAHVNLCVLLFSESNELDLPP
jgi:hypothetical protein